MPRIYNDDGTFEDVEHINWYLLAGPDIYVEPRTTPLCHVPKIMKGSTPIDGGNLLLSPGERDELIKKCPQAEKYIRQFLGAEEFIYNKKRYCLWLVDCPPDELRKMKPVYERVKKVREFRLKSKREITRKFADTPQLFAEIRQHKENYIAIPEVSSERRKYIPMDFLLPELIPSNKLQIIPNANLWHFGILTSSVHMAWTRTVCGRLTSRIDYSAKLVYNNFVWKQMTPTQFIKLVESSKKILDARKNYPNASLADLYDEIAMPKDLRAAHKLNDKVVMDIYGFDESMTDEEIAISLLEVYKFVSDYKDGVTD